MLWIADEPIAGQLVRKEPRFASPHGVRLPGQRSGPAATLPIWPVNRCRLISALCLATPEVLWPSPMQ